MGTNSVASTLNEKFGGEVSVRFSAELDSLRLSTNLWPMSQPRSSQLADSVREATLALYAALARATTSISSL